METAVTADHLLMGTFLSAEQSWHLLHDANLLHAHRRFASAYVLSVSCIEEVGLSRIRLELTDKVLQRRLVTAKEVNTRDHPKKLQSGDTSPIVVAFWGEPDSEEERNALEEIRATKENRPQESHKRRFKYQYVDLNPDDLVWNRPADTTLDDAAWMLTNAAAEYSLLRNKLMRKIEEPDFQKIAEQIDLPELPEPSSACKD